MPLESDDVWNNRFRDAFMQVYEKGKVAGSRDVVIAVLQQRFAHLDEDNALLKLAVPILFCERETLEELVQVIATAPLAQFWYQLGVDKTWGPPPAEDGAMSR